MCFGLRGKDYHILNRKYSKEEYIKRLGELWTGDLQQLKALKDSFTEKNSNQQIHLFSDCTNNENVTGDHVINSKESFNCFDSANLEDCYNIIFGYDSKSCSDCYVLVDNSELCYETVSTVQQYNCQFTYCSWYSSNSMYLDHCVSCKDCFACSGLRYKQYCIFNKEYSPEAYKQLKAQIISHMKQYGEWGKPFPKSFSPFGYNETVADEYYPMQQEQCEREGWKWVEQRSSQSAYQGPMAEVPEHIQDVSEDIVEKIFTCEVSGKLYKFIPQEVQQYRKHNVSLPSRCFDERHMQRVKHRNPRSLWKRECMKCNTVVSSSFSPERPETVYCEPCYADIVC